MSDATNKLDVFKTLSEKWKADIRAAMEERGLNQSQLADLTGMTRQGMSDFFVSNGNTTLWTVVKISLALGCIPVLTLVPTPAPMTRAAEIAARSTL